MIRTESFLNQLQFEKKKCGKKSYENNFQNALLFLPFYSNYPCNEKNDKRLIR